MPVGLRESPLRNLRCSAAVFSHLLLLLCTDSPVTTLIARLMDDAIDALLAAADPLADAPMQQDLPQAALAAHSGWCDYGDDVQLSPSSNQR